MSFTQVSWFRFIAYFTQMSTFSVILACTVWLTDYRSDWLAVCLYVCLTISVFLLVYLSVGLSVWLTVVRPVGRSFICWSVAICWSVWRTTGPFVCLSVCLSDWMSDWMNVWLIDWPITVCLSVCLHVLMFFSFDTPQNPHGWDVLCYESCQHITVVLEKSCQGKSYSW